MMNNPGAYVPPERHKEEIQQMLKLAFSIPGLVSSAEAPFIYELARRRGNLVEIGCWLGRTTVIMQLAAQVFGAHLASVDRFRQAGTKHLLGRNYISSPEHWAANVRKCGLPIPELFAMTSDEARPLYGNREIAMLFIDGDHKANQIRSDLENWAPLIKMGGYLACHDVFIPGSAEVIPTIVDWWLGQRRQWRCMGLSGSTLAFKKVKGYDFGIVH